MIAGLVLKESEREKSSLAFAGEETECLDLETNVEIAEEVAERKPEVLAADVGLSEPRKGMTEQEEKLKEEGYPFIPSSEDSKRVRRMEALKAALVEKMGEEAPEIVRFDPHITAEELAIQSDEALESLGVDTSGISSAQQFDAMLGAVTARFYQQNSVKDLGIIVPVQVEEESDGNT